MEDSKQLRLQSPIRDAAVIANYIRGGRFQRSLSLKVPKGVIGLISALAFHRMTAQIPHAVHRELHQFFALFFLDKKFPNSGSEFESWCEIYFFCGVY